MLAYLTTDVGDRAAASASAAAGKPICSFNAVTVDDHTSTNDTLRVAGQRDGGAKLDQRPGGSEHFSAALNEVCQSLAYQIAADGEGRDQGREDSR